MMHRNSSLNNQKNNSFQDMQKFRNNGGSLLERSSESRNERHAKIEVLRNLLGNKRRTTIANDFDPSSSLSTSECIIDSKTPILIKRKRVLGGNMASPSISIKSDDKKTKLLQSLSKENRKTPIGPVSLSARKRNLTYIVNKNNIYQQECKRSLVFKQTINEVEKEESFTQILPQVDLTSINLEGSMLITSNSDNLLKQSHVKNKKMISHMSSSSPKDLKLKSFCRENTCADDEANKENIKVKPKSTYQSRLPLLKRASIASYPHSHVLSECNTKKVLDREALLTRRSMSAISVNQKKAHASTTAAALSSVVVKVTKPSLSEDDSLVKESITKNSPILSNKLNSSYQNNIVNKTTLSQKEINCESSSSHCSANNIENNTETSSNPMLPLVLSKEAFLPSNLAIKVIIKNLHETLDLISQEQQQIAYEAEEFIEETRVMVQTRTKAIMEKYENSLLPLKNLEKLLIEQLKVNKIQEVTNKGAKEKLDVIKGSNAPAVLEVPLRKVDYTFLGTPMPTRKKRLARSFSHPQPFIKFDDEDFNEEIPQTNSSGEKNTSHSAEELSPFTNLAGDSERLSLAPMTPKSRLNLLNVKEKLNQQLGLLFD